MDSLRKGEPGFLKNHLNTDFIKSEHDLCGDEGLSAILSSMIEGIESNNAEEGKFDNMPKSFRSILNFELVLGLSDLVTPEMIGKLSGLLDSKKSPKKVKEFAKVCEQHINEHYRIKRENKELF